MSDSVAKMDRRPRPTALTWRIAVIALVLDAFVLTLAGLSIYGNRQQYYVRAEIQSRNMSAILAETVGGYLDRIDFALRTLVDQIEHEERQGGAKPAYVNDILRLAHDRVPETLGFRMVDADGVLRYASDGPARMGEYNVADRTYFQTLRDHDDDDLVLSPPLWGRVSNMWIIILARRVNTPEGDFAGIVYAAMPLRLISTLFAGLDLDPGDAISLRGPLPGLGAVARYPETVDGAPAVGNQAVSPQFQASTAAHPDKGTYVAHAGIDGIERVLSYRRVDNYPYYMVVGLSTNRIMARWWHDSLQVVMLAGAFVVIITLGAIFVRSSLQARQRLESRLKLIEFAFDHQAEAVLLADRDGHVVYGNMAAADLFQRRRDNLAGIPIWELGLGGNRLDWPDRWATLLRGEPVTAPAEIRHADLTTTATVVTANYFAFRGEEFAVSIIRDVGEQLRYEKELRDALAVSQDLGVALARKNDELARFAEILAHHLQEPVRQQHIFAQHLARHLPKPLAPEVQQSLDAIMNAAQRHRMLLRDAESYLAFDAAGAARQMASGDLALDMALDRLHGSIASSGAVIDRTPLPILPLSAAALSDLFVALIDNAITYAHAGTPPVIRICADDSDGHIVVAVTDNGVGIPPQFHERVFRVFERLNPRPNQPGTGIGLALAKKIVEAAGGRIWIEQPDHPGTRVCFSLPRASLPTAID